MFDDNTPLGDLVPSESKYLAKEDVGEEGKNLTISGFSRETLGQGPDAEDKTIMHFAEDVKPLVLNKTNLNRLAVITKARNAGEAKGKTVNVYNDPMIEYAGKITGGIRLRPAAQAEAEPAKSEQFDDSIPF